MPTLCDYVGCTLRGVPAVCHLTHRLPIHPDQATAHPAIHLARQAINPTAAPPMRPSLAIHPRPPITARAATRPHHHTVRAIPTPGELTQASVRRDK